MTALHADGGGGGKELRFQSQGPPGYEFQLATYEQGTVGKYISCLSAGGLITKASVAISKAQTCSELNDRAYINRSVESRALNTRNH